MVKICSFFKRFRKKATKEKSVENSESIEMETKNTSSHKNIQTLDSDFELWYKEQEDVIFNPLRTMSS